MTEREISRAIYAKNHSPRAIRKSKLKMRFKGERLQREIDRTREKLKLLIEIRNGRGCGE